MSSAEEQTPYHPKDAVGATIKSTLMTGSVGLFASAVQNTLAKQNIGPWGVFTRTGSTVALFAALIAATMGGAYEFVKTASANLREKEDHWNATWGGFFAGAAMGLKGKLFDLEFLFTKRLAFLESVANAVPFSVRSFPAIIGYGATVATVLGVFEFTGGKLSGFSLTPTEDDFDRRQALRTNYRSPGEETIALLGEGRGIYGPGYAERRRERIKQNYGIDVPVTQPSAS
ncbi:hypothetical protein LOZ12_000745 [Ophidiomyces ophidiicola]|uniref:Uncharacterized protein n=1 Tax=Ophidiomyces ophidiicola TaxID=1387563 RepID=A0ACB8UVT4_9EURO|nr:uncharacterized protein LOZ57_005402 [Ophidiomyces ophidiicola]KAI1929262.1 hypothetical protein LOZ60_001731 [Ophidiomyces ophidiicola]KAI1942179.1 hypothetical protein LOZ57_005402 [Ophidiomyces ophidiicola]KAI2009946.1 hypothetical protein LOZ50_001368 [Ophidiomyces ophidiicola]KAI2015548.1 hypothetical protein LOZ49_000570 [Ophidiomyces ophidiicola]KAI2024810.1 hypothetical protein LOZ46_001019 [Ophidiomyces ophidiicola]